MYNITYVLNKNHHIGLFKDVYEKYAIYVDDIFIGNKFVDINKDIVYVDVKCDVSLVNFIRSKFPFKISNGTMCTKEGISFSTDKADELKYLLKIPNYIEQCKKIKSLYQTNLPCRECYSFNGNDIIDCVMYDHPYTNEPFFIIDHYNKEVMPCHGYTTSAGKDIAKKLGYKWRGLKKTKNV